MVGGGQPHSCPEVVTPSLNEAETSSYDRPAAHVSIDVEQHNTDCLSPNKIENKLATAT